MEEISLKVIFFALKKHKVLILIIGVLGIVISLLLTEYILKDRYESRIRFHVLMYIDYDNPHEVNALLFAQRVVNSCILILNSSSFLNSVIEDTQINMTSAQLNEMIGFTVLYYTEFFEVRVVSGSPELSKQIADSIARLAPDTLSVHFNRPIVGVTDLPVLAGSPFSPSLEFNIVIGFLTGILLSSAFALARVIIKDTIKDEDDLIQRHSVRVLTVVPMRKL